MRCFVNNVFHICKSQFRGEYKNSLNDTFPVPLINISFFNIVLCKMYAWHTGTSLLLIIFKIILTSEEIQVTIKNSWCHSLTLLF